MKTMACLLLLAPLLHGDPLHCTLHNAGATPGLSAHVENDALEVVWAGERGSRLRAVFGIDGAAPVVRELAVGEAVLARNLTPEFTTVSGMRRAAHGLDYEHRWDVFWDAPLTIPGRGENPGLPRKPEEIRHSSSSFDTHACEVRQEGAVALGRIGGKEANEALTYFAEHSVFPQVRRTATDVLEEYAARLKPAPAPAPAR